MFLALVKIPFLFLDAAAMWLSARPPNTPSPAEKHIIPDWRERFLKSLSLPGIFLRTTYWMAGISEVLVILALMSPDTRISHFLLHHLLFSTLGHTAKPHICLSWFFILGNMVTWGGSLLRLWCYSTLGRYFTFELIIQPGHVLVETGPYAVVRHPSYTGMILTIFGAYLNQVEGSWLRESGVLGTRMGAVLGILWVLLSTAVVLSLLLRMEGEDALLRGEFGEEWDDWKRRVPYRLVPWVY